MTPERWVLLGDFAAGLGLVIIPGNHLAARGLGAWLVVSPVVAVLVAAWMYLEDHRGSPARVERIRENPFALAGIVFAGAVLLVPPLFLRPATAAWYVAAMFGMGCGLAGYRFVYGVLRPIPERRLEQVRGG